MALPEHLRESLLSRGKSLLPQKLGLARAGWLWSRSINTFHQTGAGNLMLPLRHASAELLLDGLRAPRLQRAIGVVYRPETERVSHYYRTVLPRQFDEYIWCDETQAIALLRAKDLGALPAAHPLRVP